jgi:Protein of unknown function (DUF2934)
MAPRRTTKTQSGQKQTIEPERIVVNVSSNGDRTVISSGANGASASFQQIQRRAYELFMARGGAHGWDWDDWFMAEQELNAASAAAR